MVKDRILACVRGFLRWFPALVLALLAFTALGNLAGGERWKLERLVHFAPYWSLLALGLGLWFASQKRWRLMACGGVLALGFGGQVGALWIAPETVPSAAVAPASPAPTLSVMSFNVFARNKRHADVLAALQAARPDVLYLTELNPEWRTALAPLEQSYPHRIGEHGNALWSQFPLEQAGRVSVNFDAAQTIIRATPGAMDPLEESLRKRWWNSEVLAATICAHGKRLRLAGIHPPVPGSEPRMHIQRVTALLCRRELQADPAADARVLVGDFNTTCFSPTFRFILEQTELRDSARGFGYVPTWGPRLPREPWLPWLGIPIDHVLVSPGVDVVEREVGPELGSDHRWVKVKLGV
jgi:endonuclease/exonuclease/phosphatase (EEP) superfamily protein YafD